MAKHGMPDRAALLLYCSKEEAATIREHARRQHRGVSSYILHVVLSAVTFQEMLLGHLNHRPKPKLAPLTIDPIGYPRTTMLVRCAGREAEAIHHAARMRNISTSRFMLHCLRRSWSVRRYEDLATALEQAAEISARFRPAEIWARFHPAEKAMSFTFNERINEVRWSRSSCGEVGCADSDCVCALCAGPIGVPEDDPRRRGHEADCPGCELCEDDFPVILWRGEGKDTVEARFHVRCFQRLLEK